MASRRLRPNTWLWTIAGAGGLAWGLMAVVFAAVGPSELVPHILSSYHIEHFAAFYCLTTLAAVGLPRLGLVQIALSLALVAIALAVVRLTIPRHVLNDAEDLVADLGGIAAAVLPILVGRFRQIVAQRPTAPEQA